MITLFGNFSGEGDKKITPQIDKMPNLLKFKEKVNFSKGYRKQIQLDRIIKKIKFPHWETKNKIVRLIKNGICRRKEIANRLKMNEYVVYGHLHGWKRRNKKSTLGLIDLGIVKIKKIKKINLYYV